MSVVQKSIIKDICIMEIKKKFGKNLKRLRIEKGLSQESLALLADLDRTYVPSIEKGERSVSIAVVEKLSKALHVQISEFFKD